VSISKAAGGFVCLVIILAQAEKVSGPLLGQQGPLALPGLGRHRAIAALGMLSLAAFVVAGHVRNRLGHPRPARITQGIAGLVFASVGACQLARAGGQLNMTSVVMILMLLAWLTTLAGGVLGGLNGLGILRRPAVMDTLGLWLVYGGIAAGLLIVLASCPGAGGARFWAWLNVFRGLVLPLTLVYLLLSGICGIIVDSAIKLSEARPA